MATASRRWRASFRVPFQEGIHTIIHAYLRTSQYGTWEVDESLPSDLFVLNYLRGKPISPPPSKVRYFFLPGLHSYETLTSRWADSIAMPLMQLRAALRPSPDHILVSLECGIAGPNADVLPTEHLRRFSGEFRKEVAALAAYLKELLHLPETPAITNE